MKKVLVVGELNVDIILQGYRAFPRPGKEVQIDGFELVLGSASAICAMGPARLGDAVCLLGNVGDEAWDRRGTDPGRACWHLTRRTRMATPETAGRT